MVKRLRIYGVLFVVFTCLVLSGGCVTAMLTSPMEMLLYPYSYPVSLGRIEKAIEEALLERGWAIDGRGAGQIVATLKVRSHVVRVRFLYDTRKIRVFYIDSKNMQYDGQVIHKKYHIWIELLFKSIRNNLASGPR